MIPSVDKASILFKRLFLQGSAAEVDARVRQLAMGRSVLDAVADQTRGLQAGLDPKDRDRIDQYLTGVRDLEKRLAAAGKWEHRRRGDRRRRGRR